MYVDDISGWIVIPYPRDWKRHCLRIMGDVWLPFSQWLHNTISALINRDVLNPAIYLVYFKRGTFCVPFDILLLCTLSKSNTN